MFKFKLETSLLPEHQPVCCVLLDCNFRNKRNSAQLNKPKSSLLIDYSFSFFFFLYVLSRGADLGATHITCIDT